MKKYWNFREILGVHPESDKRCVAFNVGSEIRCGITGMAGQANLTKAGQLLDTMDRTLSLSDCREHLDNLAYLTMCGSPHRNMENIRADRCRRWNNQISAYLASDKGKKAKAHARKSKKALEIRNAGEDIAAKLSNGETGPTVWYILLNIVADN